LLFDIPQESFSQSFRIQSSFQLNHSNMGRGDIKTKKGKITKASFGKSRPAKTKKKAAPKKAEK
jgi:30S ribosomal protein S31